MAWTHVASRGRSPNGSKACRQRTARSTCASTPNGMDSHIHVQSIPPSSAAHSPVQSKFPESMRFKDQRTIYNKVVAWQQPVKEGYAKITADLLKISDMLQTTKVDNSTKAQVQTYADQARAIVAKIKDDGSWGVHGPKYAKQLVDQGAVYTTEALALLNKGAAK